MKTQEIELSSMITIKVKVNNSVKLKLKDFDIILNLYQVSIDGFDLKFELI